MFTTSRPPGRSTRRSSASAAAGSTAAWHSTSAAMAASKLASAKGRALMLPRAIGGAAISRPRGAAAVAGPLHAGKRQVGTGGAQRGQQAAGAAAGVQHPAATPGERVEQARMQGAVPPHPVLGGVHQGVFGGSMRVLWRERKQGQGSALDLPRAERASGTAGQWPSGT